MTDYALELIRRHEARKKEAENSMFNKYLNKLLTDIKGGFSRKKHHKNPEVPEASGNPTLPEKEVIVEIPIDEMLQFNENNITE